MLNGYFHSLSALVEHVLKRRKVFKIKTVLFLKTKYSKNNTGIFFPANVFIDLNHGTGLPQLITLYRLILNIMFSNL